MWGFQAAGAAPIVLGHPVANPETIATAIRIGNPASWVPALEVIHESLGDIRAVTDEEIIEAYHYVARYESIFCEPASAASVAGCHQVRRAQGLDGRVRADGQRPEGSRHRRELE
jgi:threonine synthase